MSESYALVFRTFTTTISDYPFERLVCMVIYTAQSDIVVQHGRMGSASYQNVFVVLGVHRCMVEITIPDYRTPTISRRPKSKGVYALGSERRLVYNIC